MKSVKKKERPRGFDGVVLMGLILVFGVTVYLVLNSGRIIQNPDERTQKQVSIREPAVSGQFYPSNAEKLESGILQYLSQVNKTEKPGKIRALISPHAGYIYSAPVAAYGYGMLEDETFSTVIILGTSHHVYLEGAALDNVSDFKTPLGLVPVSDKAGNLSKEQHFSVNHLAHEKEHSLEVQLPFLQKVLRNNFTILPIVIGRADPGELASVLEKYVDDDTLVIASSDLSHYYSYDKAVELDRNCVNGVNNLDNSMLSQCEACGLIPILTVMKIAENKGWSGKVLDYRNSGDTAGDKKSVVGYMSAVFYDGLSSDERSFLIELSRSVLESHVKNGVTPEIATEIPERLKEVKGCFVTLNKNKQLRGCIGHIIPQEPLYQCVMDNTINAASNDPRFRPVATGELNDIEVEISVLTVPRTLRFSSPDDLLNRLVPLRDGVVLKSGRHQATYLPQVWEMIPDKSDFLSSLCEKGGADAGCWRDNVEISVYQAEVFNEKS